MNGSPGQVAQSSGPIKWPNQVAQSSGPIKWPNQVASSERPVPCALIDG
jgi:hypothetical protein